MIRDVFSFTSDLPGFIFWLSANVETFPSYIKVDESGAPYLNMDMIPVEKTGTNSVTRLKLNEDQYQALLSAPVEILAAVEFGQDAFAVLDDDGLAKLYSAYDITPLTFIDEGGVEHTQARSACPGMFA